MDQDCSHPHGAKRWIDTGTGLRSPLFWCAACGALGATRALKLIPVGEPVAMARDGVCRPLELFWCVPGTWVDTAGDTRSIFATEVRDDEETR
jgi:hypothetical protein